MTMKSRYLKGLEKLEFASSQVAIMQEELKELQPELIQTSQETEELIKVIAEETSEVEDKKKVTCIASFRKAFVSSQRDNTNQFAREANFFP